MRWTATRIPTAPHKMPDSQHLLLLADTHVGDRTKALSKKLLSAIESENPDLILHAGDVCQPSAIQTLEAIALVRAVQGNRDWLLGHKLPTLEQFEINGLAITLIHGHINIWRYLLNYARVFLTGMHATRRSYEYQLASMYPHSDIIIYGHTHFQSDDFHDGIRFLNPGAGYPQWTSRFKLQYMVLDIDSMGNCKVAQRTLDP